MKRFPLGAAATLRLGFLDALERAQFWRGFRIEMPPMKYIIYMLYYYEHSRPEFIPSRLEIFP